MFTDYHVHTEFSDDSDYLMEDVIKDAIIRDKVLDYLVDYCVQVEQSDNN